MTSDDDGFRLRVLGHIELHSEGGRYGCRVPDDWIGEANASVADGQSTADRRGRMLTEQGRALLRSGGAPIADPS